MSQQRTSILNKFKTRLNTYYGPSGSELKMFRKVLGGPLRPTKQHPSATISDNGQSKGPDNDEVSQGRILGIRTWLHLSDTWERLTTFQEWSDNVELIIHKMQNWLPASCGATRMEYVSDDPIDVIFTSGATEALWVVDFEAHYFTEMELRDNWT